MSTIRLFQSNNDRDSGIQVQWDPQWSPDTKLQALKKYCGNKFFWVDRGQRREHLAITIQVLLDQKASQASLVSEIRYSEHQFREQAATSLPN